MHFLPFNFLNITILVFVILKKVNVQLNLVEFSRLGCEEER